MPDHGYLVVLKDISAEEESMREMDKMRQETIATAQAVIDKQMRVAQEIASLLRRMADLRASEVLVQNGGTGYRFNNEGNQVSYRCDVKRVTSINFDRNKIRKMCVDLSKKSDEVSASLDAALVNTQVEYTVPFDVNDSFAEIFEAFLSDMTAA